MIYEMLLNRFSDILSIEKTSKTIIKVVLKEYIKIGDSENLDYYVCSMHQKKLNLFVI